MCHKYAAWSRNKISQNLRRNPNPPSNTGTLFTLKGYRHYFLFFFGFLALGHFICGCLRAVQYIVIATSDASFRLTKAWATVQTILTRIINLINLINVDIIFHQFLSVYFNESPLCEQWTIIMWAHLWGWKCLPGSGFFVKPCLWVARFATICYKHDLRQCRSMLFMLFCPKFWAMVLSFEIFLRQGGMSQNGNR